MEVSGQTHAPAALPPEKNPLPRTHFIGVWVDPRAGLDAVAKNKYPITAPAENWIPVFHLVA
jgi:hypothetical protein